MIGNENGYWFSHLRRRVIIVVISALVAFSIMVWLTMNQEPSGAALLMEGNVFSCEARDCAICVQVADDVTWNHYEYDDNGAIQSKEGGITIDGALIKKGHKNGICLGNNINGIRLMNSMIE